MAFNSRPTWTAEPRMTEGLAVLTNGDKWLLYLLGDGRRLDDIAPYEVDLTRYAPDFIAKTLNELMGRQKLVVNQPSARGPRPGPT